MSLAEGVKDWFRQHAFWDVSQKAALARAQMALASGLDPNIYGRPLPGSTMTIVNQTGAPVTPAATTPAATPPAAVTPTPTVSTTTAPATPPPATSTAAPWPAWVKGLVTSAALLAGGIPAGIALWPKPAPPVVPIVSTTVPPTTVQPATTTQPTQFDRVTRSTNAAGKVVETGRQRIRIWPDGRPTEMQLPNGSWVADTGK
jgi:hypothetical protein